MAGTTFTPALKGALLSTALVFNSAVSKDVHAQQQNVTATQQIKVPTRDARGGDYEAIMMGAAAASKGAQVLVFFGDNEAAFASAKEGARNAIAQGLPLKGMIVGSPLTPKTVNGFHISGSNQLIFFTDGTQTSIIDNPDGSISGSVVAELQRGYNQVLLPRQREAQKPAPGEITSPLSP
jgi:hypothetical protein